MLISPIDRNRSTRPEKQVSRVDSLHRVLSIGVDGESPQGGERMTSSISEGMVLRMREVRQEERRKTSPTPEPSQPERRMVIRRKKAPKKMDPRWNIESRHMLVIGLESKAGKQEFWKSGDSVTVISQTGASSEPHYSEGLVMRMRGTRLKERRNMFSASDTFQQERRIKDRRRNLVKKSDISWSIESHQVLLIALEHKDGKQEHWKSGDRVSVVPRTLAPGAKPQAGFAGEPSLLERSEEDYVFHLKTYLGNR